MIFQSLCLSNFQSSEDFPPCSKQNRFLHGQGIFQASPIIRLAHATPAFVVLWLFIKHSSLRSFPSLPFLCVVSPFSASVSPPPGGRHDQQTNAPLLVYSFHFVFLAELLVLCFGISLISLHPPHRHEACLSYLPPQPWCPVLCLEIGAQISVASVKISWYPC